MRHCSNDHPEVYEAEHKYMAPLLEEIANWLYDNHEEGAWTNLTISPDQADDGSPIYRATLYVH